MRFIITILILTLSSLFKAEACNYLPSLDGGHHSYFSLSNLGKDKLKKCCTDFISTKAFKKRGKGTEPFAFVLNAYNDFENPFILNYLLPSFNSQLVNQFWNISGNKAPPTLCI
jgi:hypothetical protein